MSKTKKIRYFIIYFNVRTENKVCCILTREWYTGLKNLEGLLREWLGEHIDIIESKIIADDVDYQYLTTIK